MRQHVLVLAAVGAAGLALLLSSAAATRPGVKLTATPPLVTSRTVATFEWIARPGTRRTRCRLRWQALPGTRDKASSLARRRAKLRRCSSPKKWAKLVRGRYTFVLIADGRRTSTSTRYSWKVVRGSAPGRRFSGNFDCYGSTPNCTATTARCTSTISSGIAPAVSAAAAGSVICLNAGSYPATKLSSLSKRSYVTVRPAHGATVTLRATTLSGTTNHIRFSGKGGTMNMAGVHLNDGNTNDTFDHIVFTDCADVELGSSSAHLLMDHDRFQNIGYQHGAICDTNSDTAKIWTHGDGPSRSTFTVSNSLFSGGCGDGVQSAAAGTQIGPGNEFTNITQSACPDTIHADVVQCVGSPGLILVGNYFHGNGNNGSAGGFLCGAGFSNFHETNVHVLNNVFADNSYAWSVHAAAWQNGLIAHNVMFRDVCLGTQTGNAASGDTLRNNVFTDSTGGITTHCEEGGSCANCSATYNLNPGSKWFGTGSVKGAPIFVRSPASGYYHYQLARSSPGYHAASDGKSMGIAP